MENVEKKGCSTCNNKGLQRQHWVMVILAVYLLFASVYGTIEFVKKIMSFF